MTTDPGLTKMLAFIGSYQQQRPQQTAAAIVRELRAYTKPGYTSTFWELVAGYNPDFVKGELDDETVIMAGQAVDFAHLIAALSDQFVGGNLVSRLADRFFYLRSHLFSNIPYDTREFTAAIGDTAQPIEMYLAKYGSDTYDRAKLQQMLRSFASDKDYAADILAFVIGRSLRDKPQQSITEVMGQIDKTPFAESVRLYLSTTLGAKISQPSSSLENLAAVKHEIQRRIRAYLIYKRDTLKESLLNFNYRLKVRPALISDAADHFLTYLLHKAQLSG
ncbi:MAG: hypothetical protein F6K04_22800 [Leptolyngbya sp. SIO4C5]|uniref:hypothetical protein n=1 Tax=Sphaerothrix gracilis TaxID=3151835 RepID=UPI0013C0636B|nr:hypothetical protein [Leptolyngbya sp. SIO4C5]